jgi:hypothetical protein
MKTAELLEQIQVRKTPAERAALKAAPDYWRKQLRKEMTEFNQEFGIYLRNSVKFSKIDDTRCDLGGDYEFLASADPTAFTQMQRFNMWKKAYAKKIKEWVDGGYRVFLFTMRSEPLGKGISEAEILNNMSSNMNPLYRGSDITKAALLVFYVIYIREPKSV